METQVVHVNIIITVLVGCRGSAALKSFILLANAAQCCHAYRFVELIKSALALSIDYFSRVINS